MTVPELLAYQRWLMAALTVDAVLSLASLVAQLDPLWLFDDYWFDRQFDPADPDDQLEYSLHVSRACFPDLYVQAVEQLHAGMKAEHISQGIATGILEAGIPVEDPEMLWYGIPIPGLGTRLNDPDWLRNHTDLLPILDLFGVYLNEDASDVNIPEDAEDMGLMLVASLSAYEADASLSDLAALLAWLWGASGNSSVDWDDDMLAEAPPLDWTPDHVALAHDIIAEAGEILAQAARARERLQPGEYLAEALRRNVAIARKELAGRNAFHVLRSSPHNPNPLGLVWPAAGEGTGRAAQPGAELLQLRHHPAETHG